MARKMAFRPEYEWRPGAQHQAVSAQIVGETLAALEEEHDGQLEPATVVDAARHHDSPLHECFEWDDAVAAEKHRKREARELLAAVVILHPGQPLGSEPVRAFVNVSPEDGGRHYTGVSRAMGDDYLRSSLLASARRDMEAYERRYGILSELAGVFEAAEGAALLKRSRRRRKTPEQPSA